MKKLIGLVCASLILFNATALPLQAASKKKPAHAAHAKHKKQKKKPPKKATKLGSPMKCVGEKRR